MKMNSYQQNDRTARRKLFAVTVLVVFLFVADVISGGKIRGALRDSQTVFAGGLKATVTFLSGDVFSTRASLEAQNQSLTAKISQMQDAIAADSGLRQENEQLRGLLHLATTTPGIAAAIVSSENASPYGTFLIGAGTTDTVARGDLVLSPGGFVIGVVSDVSLHAAVVKEIFAPGNATEAIISGTTAMMQGEGADTGVANVPRGISIQVGQSAIAPQFGQRPIGIVGAVASSSASASQAIYLTLPDHLASLPYVYVAFTRN